MKFWIFMKIQIFRVFHEMRICFNHSSLDSISSPAFNFRPSIRISNPLFDLLKSIQATKPFVILSVDKGQELNPTVLYSSDTSDIGKGIVPYYRLSHTYPFF